MSGQNTIHMEALGPEGGLQSSFSELDGRNACLEQCPQEFKSKYRVCCEDIKNSSLQFIEALNELIAEGERCHVLHPLDVAEDVTNDHGLPTHRMTLLAYSIYYRNRNASEYLMEKKANILVCNDEAGSPLFQVMAHCHTNMLSCCHDHHQAIIGAHSNSINLSCTDCWHTDTHEHSHNDIITDCCHDHYKMKTCCHQHNVLHQCTCYHKLDEDAVQSFIDMYCAKTLDKAPNALRDRDYEQFPDLHLATRGGSYPYNICYMAFSLRQTKNAKFLIRIGADYLESNSNHNSLPSYLLEYCKSGKADYLSWLFSTLSTSNLEKLIKRITTDGGDYDTVDSGKTEAASSHFERNPTHALLLSGNEHVTRELLGKGPQDSCNILCVKVDLKQRTALHIAAEMGQEESVKTIIELGGDVTRRDENNETPLTIAAKKKHYGVVKHILGHLMGRLNTEVDENTSQELERFILNQLEELTSNEGDDPFEIFNVKKVDLLESALIIAVESGNSRVIKAISCKFGIEPTQNLISCAMSSGDVQMVTLLDSLCVEHVAYNRVDGLLEACWLEFTAIRDFYYDRLSAEQKKEALYLACARGNSLALEFLISKRVDPNTNRQGCPLLTAAARGYDKCVVQLLDARADPSVTDHRGYNGLMLAIERKHEAVVKAMLESKNIDKNSFFQRCTEVKKSFLGFTYTTPLRMLIKDMPEIAKQFLDSCVEEHFDKGSGKYEYDSQYIDDFEQSWVSKELQNYVLQKHRQHPENHVISCMIENKRLELLDHTLVSEWIQQKWQRAQIIFYVVLAVYCIFLAMLTAFAMASPRPADNIACTSTYVAVENKTSSCGDIFGNTKGVTVEYFPASITDENGKFLYPAGVIILVLSTLFLIVELLQVHQLRAFYFLEWQNYLQLFVFVGAIVFISALFDASVGRCWCASEGIWQLGAAVVMCCWFNFILMLKDYPFYNIGGHITLLFNICKRYLKLVYLPILLMASFGFSFYMLYVVSEGESTKAFSTPWWALASTYFGTTGFDSIFVGTPIAYPAMGIILFILFYVVVVVLFTNMLIGLSTSDAIDALKKAKLVSIANQVNFILVTDDGFPWLRKDFERYKSVGGFTESSDLQVRDYWSQQGEWKLYQQRDVKEEVASKKDISHLEMKLQSILSNQESLLEEIRQITRQSSK